MRKLLAALCLVFLLGTSAYSDDQEILTLKRDLIQERVLRIRTELELMKSQYKEGQEALKTAATELEKLNVSLKALEPAKEKK